MRRINAFNRGLARLAQPHVLFPAIALMLLVTLWAVLVAMIEMSFSRAEQAAVASSGDLLDTYESQVVRALREIDQTLNLVTYWQQRLGGHGTLADLRDKGLLPPDLLFVVSIADANGIVVDSTRPPTGQNVAATDYFRAQKSGDGFVVGRVARGERADAKLRFTRKLTAANGAFDGMVIVAVDAAYFVSGYEASTLGKKGVLGLLGADGVFLARRSGDLVSYGDAVDYAASVAPADADQVAPRISVDGSDGLRRWVVARELFGFPLAVIVGLSMDERLADAQRTRTHLLEWGALGTALIVAVMTLLGRLSWQLAQSRLRETEAALSHAQRVEYLAYHDSLTTLPNRSMFSRLLTQGIADARRANRQLAVAFLDLDRFKQINDTLGHDAGDQLLRDVAARVAGCLRQGDTVARLGGDEFVVIMAGFADIEDAAAVAQKILRAVANPFDLVGQKFRVTASIGVSTFPRDGDDEQTLTKNADLAMYQAKADGKNNVRFYSDGLNADSLERLALESSLRNALEHNEFQLHYQAKRDIRTGQVTGVEALLRWEHPDLGEVAPLRFLSIADETGLIVPIGKWVLATAARQSVEWNKEGLAPVAIAVNLTARQFTDDGLVDDVRWILESTGMRPQLLELELPESVLSNRVEDTLRIISALKGLGVKIAVGDFGTGYSSLALLQHFPLDTIKIDQSLIHAIGASAEGGMADAIIAMGKSLSVTVVAQGVETSEQAEFLRTHACDELQGFYFKRPLPAPEFTKLLFAQASQITYRGERLGLNLP